MLKINIFGEILPVEKRKTSQIVKMVQFSQKCQFCGTPDNVNFEHTRLEKFSRKCQAVALLTQEKFSRLSHPGVEINY